MPSCNTVYKQPLRFSISLCFHAVMLCYAALCCGVLCLSLLQVRLPAQRPVKAVREPMDQFCGEANADAVYKGEWTCLIFDCLPSHKWMATM
jgi:hypothetical protein